MVFHNTSDHPGGVPLDSGPKSVSFAPDAPEAPVTADEPEGGSITPNISNILGEVCERYDQPSTTEAISLGPVPRLMSGAAPFPDASHRRNSKVIHYL